jgi:tetratricopeptide (TPR) repeat protein
MTDIDFAEQHNNRGMELRDKGDIAGAEEAYRAAAAAAPQWSAPVYNLGLLCKYEGRWQESLHCNQRAAALAPDDQGSWWNLGIAATALGDWVEARRAWAACGIEVPPGDGPPEFNWGHTPVRLDPDGEGEVVWAKRLDPARARIVSVPLPTCGFHWGDMGYLHLHHL